MGLAERLPMKLIEAGVSFVEVRHSGYDTHMDNFPISKALYSKMDPAWDSHSIRAGSPIIRNAKPGGGTLKL